MRAEYTEGLRPLSDACFAWLQPDGGWGWSNAGLVIDGEASLLVDTLFDERLTSKMLHALRAAAPAANEIDVLVNTHANGDHTFGNRLVGRARIIASKASADEMESFQPAELAKLMRLASQLGETGDYLKSIFGPFAFEGIAYTPPTETFSEELELRVGARSVILREVGPAHTAGDVVVYVPDQRVVYTGDILFIGSTPILWEGPVSNWLRALDWIAGLEADVIVPGHGPLTDRSGVAQVRDYLTFLDREARARYDAGMTAEAAAFDIDLGAFADWKDAERIGVNVHTLYREYGSTAPRATILDQLTLMAKLRRELDRCL